MDADEVKMWKWLYEVTASSLPDILLKWIMSDWGTLPLPDILNRKSIKLSLSQH